MYKEAEGMMMRNRRRPGRHLKKQRRLRNTIAKEISTNVIIVAVLSERYSCNAKDKQKTTLQAFIGGQYVSIF